MTEVIITTGIFSLLVLALFAVMRYGVRSWRNIESRNAVQSQLRKVELFLLEDLKRASYEHMRVKDMSGAQPHGPQVWFLSALDETGENFLRDDDGKPLWQRNVLYYVVKPANPWHLQRYGYLCEAEIGSCDTKCPHKWLIRKEIDEQTLLDAAQIEQYLTEPTGWDLEYMKTGEGGGTKLKRVQVLADSILAFRVALAKPEVLVDLKAFRVLEAGDVLQIGQSSLENNIFTVQYDARVVPNN